VPAPATFAGRFVWPLEGTILSRFGPKPAGRYNDGINIKAPAGTPVKAAADGVVAYAGDGIAGFGGLVLLKHGDGWVTAYAHAEELLVARGDSVKRGDIVARSGATGSVDEPQLHFEIRRGRTPVDPLKYLPARGSSALN
jgi:murein DD-endopeptidase MepM/ murein hydrolase activator NlpD